MESNWSYIIVFSPCFSRLDFGVTSNAHPELLLPIDVTFERRVTEKQGIFSWKKCQQVGLAKTLRPVRVQHWGRLESWCMMCHATLSVRCTVCSLLWYVFHKMGANQLACLLTWWLCTGGRDECFQSHWAAASYLKTMRPHRRDQDGIWLTTNLYIHVHMSYIPIGINYWYMTCTSSSKLRTTCTYMY